MVFRQSRYGWLLHGACWGRKLFAVFAVGAPACSRRKLLAAASPGWVETQPDGFQIQYEQYVSGKGRVLQMVNPSSYGWTVLRDSSGRVSAVFDTAGTFNQRTTFTYGSNGLSEITDSAGRNTLVQINANGNLVQITSPDLCVTSIGYDASNRLSAWVTPAGVATSFSYDTSNRLINVQTPSGVYSISYGTGAVSITNPRGFINTYALDSGGRLQSLTNPLGQVTTYGWQNNLPASITDPQGNLYTLSYAQMQ